MRRIASVALVALLVVSAGCSGAVPSGPADATTTGAGGETTTDGASAGSGDSSADGGTLQFYVSDERNAIGAFEHLNVTVTSVTLVEANGTETTYDVTNRTVDLTRLQGANATLLSTFDVPNGTYTTVFADVGAVNATLDGGESTTVKLPSEKLHVDSEFTVGDGESVEFVFDISVVKAGNSGKYVLKPVVSESGPDVEMETVDRDDEHDLEARFVGNVTAGENATVEATENGSAVDATVVVNGRVVGETGEDGRLDVRAPADADELEVELLTDDAEAELEAEFEQSEADDEDADDEDADDGRDLEARLVGDVALGGNATVEATENGSAVNATVYVGEERVGHTGADGSLTFDVPDVDELEVTVETDDGEVELERELA